LLAARVALLASAESWCPDFARAVFKANFAEDRDISDPQVLTEILQSLGREPAGVLERAQSPASKDALKQQTEEARRLGIFGAPSLVVGGELFWGNDRLDEAIAWCGRERRQAPRTR
jgi:2-hydroxychromene-2-carboxylate isomerase